MAQNSVQCLRITVYGGAQEQSSCRTYFAWCMGSGVDRRDEHLTDGGISCQCNTPIDRMGKVLEDSDGRKLCV